MNKAIFLDRDGTINEDVNYLSEKNNLRIIPNSIEALQKFKNSGFLNIVITNQSGIARGFFTEEDLDNIHNELKKILRYKDKELIDDIFYSPYHIDGIIEKYKKDSPDRKPDIGMILSASAKYDINLSESFFIGDSYSDMICAEKAGLKKILVKTGYGKESLLKCEKENMFIDFVAEDLNDASDFITKFSANN